MLALIIMPTKGFSQQAVTDSTFGDSGKVVKSFQQKVLAVV
jgi:hypothetical protein